MQVKCNKCPIEFEITKDDIVFLNELSPTFDWIKYQITPPTLCPNCRKQRRLSFRNERNIYKRKCDLSWEDIISMYSQKYNCPVYKNEYWHWDKWDALDYWINFDFNKSFFEQFSSLLSTVPKIALSAQDMENSDYANQAWHLKNCYLTFSGNMSEDCYYSRWIDNSKNCVDTLKIYNCENCFECINCVKCYSLFYSRNSNNSSHSYFLESCSSCDYCFWCKNLRNKQYCIFNKQYSKDEYIENIKQYQLWDYVNLKKMLNKVESFYLELPFKFANILNSENIIWDSVHNCKNWLNIFDSTDVEDCKNVMEIYQWKNNNLMDVDFFGVNLSYSYESNTVWDSSRNICFSADSWNGVSDIYYCYWTIINCSNLFWCVWLSLKKYCILNKQYTKQEYEILASKIIKHMKSTWEWWEFFPIKLSPFAYNETMAQEYYPLTKEEILDNWWKWKDENDKISNVEKIIPAEKLPNNISDIPDDILNWAIKCETSQRPFKLTTQELSFYRKHSIPIPHLHPEQRHKERIKLRNPRKLFDRKCMKCEKQIQTTYSPDRSEIVYCEECYLNEVY